MGAINRSTQLTELAGYAVTVAARGGPVVALPTRLSPKRTATLLQAISDGGALGITVPTVVDDSLAGVLFPIFDVQLVHKDVSANPSGVGVLKTNTTSRQQASTIFAEAGLLTVNTTSKMRIAATTPGIGQVTADAIKV